MATNAQQRADKRAQKYRAATVATHTMQVRKQALPTTRRIDVGTYDGAELTLPAAPPGADDHKALPSRSGKYLYFRDGTVTTIS